MNRYLVLAACLLSAVAVRASESISCAFGVCLGEVLTEQLTPKHIATNIWRVQPATKNPAFNEYYVVLIPSSRVVVEISAWSTNLTEESCPVWLQTPLLNLQEKYGTFTKASDGSYSLHDEEDNRSILLNCVGAFGDWNANLRYRDTLLWKVAKEEQKKLRAREMKRGL
jgi:hypothetical protein